MKLDPNGVNNSATRFCNLFATLFGILWINLNIGIKSVIRDQIRVGLSHARNRVSHFLSYQIFQQRRRSDFAERFYCGVAHHHFRELCLSPIGMSIMTKLSPKNFRRLPWECGFWPRYGNTCRITRSRDREASEKCASV